MPTTNSQQFLRDLDKTRARASGIDFTAKRAGATYMRSLSAEPAEKQDNPMPLNISEWWDAKLEGDPRWRYGTPPRGNANFALDPAHAPSPRRGGAAWSSFSPMAP